MINVDMGSRVVLDCTCGAWLRVPEDNLSYMASNGSKIVERAGRESAGDWVCRYTLDIYILCTMYICTMYSVHFGQHGLDLNMMDKFRS